jgi:predicted AAA+ superfamily ATPase
MSVGEDTGRIFENVVFLALRRKGIEPHYWLDGQEVDFYWENGQLINACYDVSVPATMARELTGLQTAMDKLGVREAQLITWEDEGEVRSGDSVVHIRPLWKFLR